MSWSSQSTNNNSKNTKAVFPLEMWRSTTMLAVLTLALASLALWAIKVQLLDNDFLQSKGEARYSRLLEIPAPRGKIYDRNGVVLASNVPARAIWVIPEEVKMTAKQENELARLLEIGVPDIRKKIAQDKKRFVYLRRQVPQDIADKIKDMKIPGVYSQKEVKRDYPQAAVFAHLTGFTNIEGEGQEGLESVYDKEIQGVPGARKVLRDRLGNVIEDEGVMTEARPGKDVYLSLDARVQYIVYTALRQAVEYHNAKSASAMVIDTRTGEILALVNYPAYDPNMRKNMNSDLIRNRAVTDVFEPGSTLKPFTVGLALEKGKVKPQTMIATGGGKMTIGDATISDSHANGTLTVQQVIQKSSNIGTSKIAFMLEPQEMWDLFTQVGFGKPYKIGFPGVAAGLLRPYKNWQPIEQATMSYGHGIAISLLQLTHAYTIFARDGELIDLTLIKRENNDLVPGQRVLSPETAKEMRTMMHMATEPGGTAPKAQVIGYTVAGKTGTAYKVEGNGYNKSKYVASFAGLAPVSQPRIVVSVMVDDPSANGHFGGVVAAPIFSQIVSETLRTLSVTPDAPYKTSINQDGGTEEAM